LSNGDRTVTTAVGGFTRSPDQKNSGLWYFEVTCTDWNTSGASADGVGVATAACSNFEFSTSGVKCARVYRSGNIYFNDAFGGANIGGIADGALDHTHPDADQRKRTPPEDVHPQQRHAETERGQ
jgi:hypothetical protein